MKPAISGRDHYAAIYASQLDREAKWLAFGAVEKANSVEMLVPEKPQSVMELGAGTGAVIAELQRRGFARHYIAVDYSARACAHIRHTLPGVEVHEADVIQTIPARAEVVILSHVLEHLEQPDIILEAVNRLDFKWLVIECPLEDLVASRVKNLFRDRYRNLAGHVQFFTLGSLRALIERRFRIVAARHYAPWQPAEVVRFVAQKDRLGLHAAVMKHATMHWGPRYLEPLWKRLWVGNYAVLCEHR